MKERYEVIKSIYPNYLILFREKDKIKSYGIDKGIIELFSLKKLNNVNRIILNNLEIEEKIEYENNEYDLYYAKYKLINFIKNI